jgi:predicted Zn-dependent peptidase
MTLVIVGDVSRDAAVDAARAAFGGAAAATSPPEPPAVAAAPPAEDRPRNGVARAAPVVLDRRLVTTVIGFPAPSVRMAEDAVAMDVLLRILAGGGRGRLADRLVRQDQIALAVGADYLTQRAPGLFLLTAIGRPDADPKRLEDALLAEVRRLVEDGVSHDEVEDAKSATAGQILFDEETFAGQASQLAFYDAIDPVDGYRFAVLYPGRVRAVRADDLLGSPGATSPRTATPWRRCFRSGPPFRKRRPRRPADDDAPGPTRPRAGGGALIRAVAAPPRRWQLHARRRRHGR